MNFAVNTMNQDDNSREVLKPGHEAQERLSTISRALSRLEAVVAVKFSLERPAVEVQSRPEEVITETPAITTIEAAAEMHVGKDGELDIDGIRFHIEEIYSDQPDEIEGERAA